jgi:serine/threonine protein kinase/Tol biopolymer transport system component
MHSSFDGEDDAVEEAKREQFRRADALFDAALDLDTAARVAYVNSMSSHDAGLRDQVLALLIAHERSREFLNTPAVSDALQVRLQRAVGETYLIRRRIAEGGMASVYLADDVRHERRVAIKVFSSDEVTGGSNSTPGTERFLAEIRVMARLQHPNLLPLFDSGASDGLWYYAMPFVLGETLREYLQNASPLPIDEALRLTHAIASAVQHAHDQGVVHRDLKPANILLCDGQPLVADFGIALALSDHRGERKTRSGVVIGTAQYMSPEQATGEHTLDTRSDIYSLGAMLYEMLVGDPPHVASSMQGVLAKVRAERPTSVHLLRETVPMSVSAAIDRALAKRPGDRFQSMREFDAALATASAPLSTTPSALPNTRATQSRIHAPASSRSAFAAAALLVLTAGVFVVRGDRAQGVARVSRTVSRFVVAPLADAAIGRAPSITPDGTTLVYAGSAETGRRLFVRNVNELSARALPGTEGALSTFISPDGKWIGVITRDDKLWKVSIAGGLPTVLTGAFRYSGAAWVGNSHIVLDTYGAQGLSWVSANGGPSHQLTQLDTLRRDSGHWDPVVSSDARTIVFLTSHDRSGPGPQAGELSMVTFDTSATSPAAITMLGIQSRAPVAFVDGWLLYLSVDGRSIMAVAFDAASRATSGRPVQVLEQSDGGLARATVAANGTLLYTRLITSNAPVLVDTTGNAQPLLHGVNGSFMNPRLSPDGKRVSMQVSNANGNDVWLYDVVSNTPSRITSTGGAVGPTFTPDGRSVVFFSRQDAHDAVWRAPTDGRTPPERVAVIDGVFGLSVSPDGQRLIFQRLMNGTWSVWYAKLEGDHTPHPFIVDKFDAFMPSLSPDGHWMAYSTNESGRYEIYVRAFPGPGATVQVSRDGGTEPLWSADGSSLYFRGDRRMLVADIVARGSLSVTKRRVLFSDAFDGDMPMPHRNYDLTRDGKFIMIAANASDKQQTIVVLNWLDELRAKLAAAKSVN